MELIRTGPKARRLGIRMASVCLAGFWISGCVMPPAYEPPPPAERPLLRPLPPPARVPEASKPLPRVEPAKLPSPVPAPTPAAKETGVSAFDGHLALQVGLDRLGFSPGCVDGRLGRQTKMAIEAWEEANGRAVTGEATPELTARVAAAEPVVRYAVTEDDHDSLTVFPASWRERAQLPRLGHETILEALAERFHVSEACLRKLNPAVKWPDPPAGTAIVVPNVAAAIGGTAARLEINLARKYVRAFDARGRMLAHFPCSIAKLKEKRPKGDTTVINAAANPTYTFDPELFADDPAAQGITNKLIIQPGPNNPVGVAWVGLGLPGYGIHGSPFPEDIGRTASHGCIRLHNWNAERLLRIVRTGIPVTFAGGD